MNSFIDLKSVIVLAVLKMCWKSMHPCLCSAAKVKALIDIISNRQEVLKFRKEVLVKKAVCDGDNDDDDDAGVSGETGEAQALAAVEDEALSPAKAKKKMEAGKRKVTSGAKTAKKSKKKEKKKEGKKKKQQEYEEDYDSDEEEFDSSDIFETSSSSDEDHIGNDKVPAKKKRSG